MKTPTRQRLVESATHRFYRDGFRSVGIDQVLADVGISKTAFYKHFESKEDLMIAVLESQNEKMQSIFRTMARERGGDTAVGQLHALMDVVEYLIESDEFHGCIFVNAAVEFPLLHEPAHIAASESKKELERFVVELAEEAEADDAESLARELCLIMEGTYVRRHMTGNKRAVDIARQIANLVIASRCPSPAS